jgi:septal ring factor EnvC (AmiA/AmiB activator)
VTGGRAGAGFLLAGLLLQAAAAPAGATPRQQPTGAGPAAPGRQERFDALLKEIALLKADLEKIQRQERGMLGEMDRLAVEGALRSREAARLASERARATAELDRTRRERARVQQEVEAGERDLARRLRQLYIHGKQRDVRFLLAVARPVDLLRGVAYLDVMASRQGAAVSALQDARVRAATLESALASQVDSLQRLESEQRDEAAALAAARERSAGLLRAAREDGDTHRRAIAELSRAAEELESAIVAGLRGAPVPEDSATGWVDPGSLRGVLPWPVPGRVKVPFGDIVHPRFRTVTPHPGLDIETDPGAPVQAVLGGRVVFSRRFAGYGNTVLLDHGGRYLSVYARAAVLSVAEGEDVVPGQKLGVAAETGPDGGAPLVYFELRHEGKTMDPAGWLKRRGDGRSPREDAR